MKRPTQRWLKLQRIGQAHLAPGMNLRCWRAILDRHNIGKTWHGVPDKTIDAIIADIAAIVRAAKEER